MSTRKNSISDSFIEIEGRKKTIIYHLYDFICIITFGLFYMICKYSPKIKIIFTTKKSDLKSADSVVVTNKFNKLELTDILIYKCDNSSRMSRYICDGIVRVLDTEYARLIYDVGYNRFVIYNQRKIENNFEKIYLNKIKIQEHEEKIDLREKEILFGKNTNNLRLPSVSEILLKNTFNITNLIDIFCVVLWFNIQYKVYGSIVALFRLWSYIQDNYSEISQKYEIESSQKHIKIRTLRKGSFVYIESYDLYPGDLVYIEPCEEFPADVIILKGDAITDESFLTGESVPICKSGNQGSIVYSGTAVLRSVDDSKWLPNTKFESLYRVKNLTKRDERTQKYKENGVYLSDDKIEKIKSAKIDTGHIIDTNKNKRKTLDNYALGIVSATGFNTARGKIMKDIINPKPVQIPFLIEARTYIFYTIILASICTVFFCIYFELVLHWDYLDNFIYSADLFFTLASPALYASLSVGIQISSKRLNEYGIKCNNTNRIFISGNIDMAVFDKTGTLTSEGMDFLYLDNLKTKATEIKQFDTIERVGLSSCHSVYELDGKYSGDALDIQMFIVSESRLEMDPENVDIKNEYDNIRKVIMGGSNELTGPFLKEHGEESDKLFYQNVNEDTFLNSNEHNTILILRTYDFTSDLKRMSVIIERGGKKYIYTKGSPDIIQTLLKDVPFDYENRVKEHSLSGFRVIAMGYKEIETIGTQEENERDLEFVGLIVFSNKLKPETFDVIKELNFANIKSVICTGDNILTAISVGRECRLIDDSITVIFPVLHENCNSVYDVEWVCLGDEDLVFDKVRLILYKNNFDTYCNDFVIACEGKEYDYFKNTSYYDLILDKGRVFARFSPAQKKSLVEDFRNINKNVLFCGDGANDSGAIGTADVGIALAQNEASLASSFCARDINTVPLLIKECRNAYVTSITLFKYVSMSYFLAFVCLGFPVLRCLFLSDFQTLHIDIFIIVPMMFFISNFKKSEKLYKISPNCSLFGLDEILPFFVSLFLQCVIIFILSFYGPGSDEITEESKAGTMIFFVAAFQSIFNGIYLSDAVPHRESIYQNGKILIVGFLFMLWNFLLLIVNWYNYELTLRILSIYLFVEINNSEFKIIILGILCSVIACFVAPYYTRKFICKNKLY